MSFTNRKAVCRNALKQFQIVVVGQQFYLHLQLQLSLSTFYNYNRPCVLSKKCQALINEYSIVLYSCAQDVRNKLLISRITLCLTKLALKVPSLTVVSVIPRFPSNNKLAPPDSPFEPIQLKYIKDAFCLRNVVNDVPIFLCIQMQVGCLLQSFPVI